MDSLKHPFSAIISGPSGCGKSHFVADFIRHLDTMCDHPPPPENTTTTTPEVSVLPIPAVLNTVPVQALIALVRARRHSEPSEWREFLTALLKNKRPKKLIVNPKSLASIRDPTPVLQPLTPSQRPKKKNLKRVDENRRWGPTTPQEAASNQRVPIKEASQRCASHNHESRRSDQTSWKVKTFAPGKQSRNTQPPQKICLINHEIILRRMCGDRMVVISEKQDAGLKRVTYLIRVDLNDVAVDRRNMWLTPVARYCNDLIDTLVVDVCDTPTESADVIDLEQPTVETHIRNLDLISATYYTRQVIGLDYYMLDCILKTILPTHLRDTVEKPHSFKVVIYSCVDLSCRAAKLAPDGVILTGLCASGVVLLLSEQGSKFDSPVSESNNGLASVISKQFLLQYHQDEYRCQMCRILCQEEYRCQVCHIHCQEEYRCQVCHIHCQEEYVCQVSGVSYSLSGGIQVSGPSYSLSGGIQVSGVSYSLSGGIQVSGVSYSQSGGRKSGVRCNNIFSQEEVRCQVRHIQSGGIQVSGVSYSQSGGRKSGVRCNIFSQEEGSQVSGVTYSVRRKSGVSYSLTGGSQTCLLESLEIILLKLPRANIGLGHEVALCVSHSPLASSNRIKPRSGDWVITVDFLQEAAITSLYNDSNVKIDPSSKTKYLGKYHEHGAEKVRTTLETRHQTLFLNKQEILRGWGDRGQQGNVDKHSQDKLSSSYSIPLGTYKQITDRCPPTSTILFTKFQNQAAVPNVWYVPGSMGVPTQKNVNNGGTYASSKKKGEIGLVVDDICHYGVAISGLFLPKWYSNCMFNLSLHPSCLDPILDLLVQMIKIFRFLTQGAAVVGRLQNGMQMFNLGAWTMSSDMSVVLSDIESLLGWWGSSGSNLFNPLYLHHHHTSNRDSRCRDFLMFHRDSRCRDFLMFHRDSRCRNFLPFHRD
uniref:Uncharacterized protein n=1 Tax=Timema bartmani TaxID=61472 RepID=A0A7R9I281_9NEOP|nr:unnamed protein product [Timema bartmani]